MSTQEDSPGMLRTFSLLSKSNGPPSHARSYEDQEPRRGGRSSGGYNNTRCVFFSALSSGDSPYHCPDFGSTVYVRYQLKPHGRIENERRKTTSKPNWHNDSFTSKICYGIVPNHSQIFSNHVPLVTEVVVVKLCGFEGMTPRESK